jgi:N-acetylmuramoyl-L-alanine amidase
MTFIELGNIQNFKDQQRILTPNNRQAIANWLTDGLIEYYKGK